MRVKRQFFTRETRIVASELLGKIIVHNNRRLIISETEAYLGPEDQASHARFGQTARKKIMWQRGGHLYVYLIYGIYDMTNVITGNENEPGAVLLRAGITIDGTSIVGPGLFSQYLGVSRDLTGTDFVTSSALFIDDQGVLPTTIITTPRIGIDYAGQWSKKKLRYVARFNL